MINLTIWTAPIYAALVLAIFGLGSPIFARLHAVMGVISLSLVCVVTYLFTIYQFGVDSLLVGSFIDVLFGAAIAITLMKYEKVNISSENKNKIIRLYIYYTVLLVSFLSTALISFYSWIVLSSGGNNLFQGITNDIILTFNIINALCLIEGGTDGVRNTISSIRSIIHISMRGDKGNSTSGKEGTD